MVFIAFIAFCFFIAFIGRYLEKTGCFECVSSSAFVCFVLPAAFALKLRVPEVRGPMGCIGAWALLLGGTVLGAIATVSTLTTLGSNPPSSEPMGDESAEQLMAPHVKACSRQCAFLSSPAD